MSERVYFFGCWERSGHFLWEPNGTHASQRTSDIPWRNLDQALCPGYREGAYTPEADQVEGQAALHHQGGWTALAWWDRSVDTRFGCNAVLIAEGTWTSEEMLRIGRERFPSIMRRFAYRITTVSRPTELVHWDARCGGCGGAGRGSSLPGGWQADPPGWFRRGARLACGPGCAVVAAKSSAEAPTPNEGPGAEPQPSTADVCVCPDRPRYFAGYAPVACSKCGLRPPEERGSHG